MNKKIIPLFALMISAHLGLAQMHCGQAAQQLQLYAGQVNQIYQNEYWTIIPNQRCPAYDAWGRPFNPVMVQNCRVQMLGYLNNWYANQCNYVNNWYAAIVRSCTNNEIDTLPAPDEQDGPDEVSEIDTQPIEELTVGMDEEKLVKIKIPRTAAGFKGGN